MTVPFEEFSPMHDFFDYTGWQNAPSNVIHFNGERFLDLTRLRPHMPNKESLWTAYGL